MASAGGVREAGLQQPVYVLNPSEPNPNPEQGRAQVLYSKQGRSSQFKSKAERDTWLKAEVGRLQQARAAKQAALAELELGSSRAADDLRALLQVRSFVRCPERRKKNQQKEDDTGRGRRGRKRG